MLITIIEAFFAGIIIYYCIPLFATAILPWEKAKPIAEQYFRTGMAFVNRGLFLKRSHGGLDFIKTQYDAKIDAEKALIGGEEKYWQDPHGYMTRFYGARIGLAHEKKNVIFDARSLLHAGEYLSSKQDGSWEIKKNVRKAYFAYTPGLKRLLDVDDILGVIQGSGKPGLVDRLDTYVEKEFQMYNSGGVLQYMPWMVSFGVTLGLIWLLNEFQGKVGSSVSIPI